MTRFFLDTEFIEDDKTIDLISIGIVSEHGAEFYRESCEWDANKAI
jgi:trehalose-6-phosphatase